jgi:hypothetical protein
MNLLPFGGNGLPQSSLDVGHHNDVGALSLLSLEIGQSRSVVFLTRLV